jgi:hypothetical protein
MNNVAPASCGLIEFIVNIYCGSLEVLLTSSILDNIGKGK